MVWSVDLAAAADNKWVKREQKIAFVSERALRAVQCCALLAITFNRTQFSFFGRTLNLTQIKEWTDWSRFAIYSHLFAHDILSQSKELKPSPAHIVDALMPLLFLHEHKYLGFQLSERGAQVASQAFSLAWVAYSVNDVHKNVNKWQKEAAVEKLPQARRNLLQAVLDNGLWMPAALLGVGGDRFLAVAGIATGAFGVYNHHQKGWEDKVKKD